MTVSRTNWLLVWLLLLTGLFAAAQFGKLTLSLGPLTQVYGVAAAPLISVVGVVGILFGVIAGPLVAGFGLRHAILTALFLGGVVSGLQSLLPPLPVMIGLRVIEGISHLAIVVAAPTLMAAISSDRDRSVTMSIWAAFFGISLAITAVLMPWLLSLGGLQSVFLAHGVGMAVAAVLIWPALPQVSTPLSKRPGFISAHRRIYSTPRLLIPGGGFVFYTILYIALLAVLPELLKLPVWMITAIPLVSLSGTFVAGFLGRSIEPMKIAVAGFVASGVFVVLLSLISGPFGVVTAGLLALLFGTMGLIPGACFAAISYFNESPEDRARATGGVAQLGNVGTSTGTPIFVWASFQGGIPLVTIVTLGFCVLGIASIVVLQARIRPR